MAESTAVLYGESVQKARLCCTVTHLCTTYSRCALEYVIHNFTFVRVILYRIFNNRLETFRFENGLDSLVVCGALTLPTDAIIGLQEYRRNLVNNVRKILEDLVEATFAINNTHSVQALPYPTTRGPWQVALTARHRLRVPTNHAITWYQ